MLVRVADSGARNSAPATRWNHFEFGPDAARSPSTSSLSCLSSSVLKSRQWGELRIFREGESFRSIEDRIAYCRMDTRANLYSSSSLSSGSGPS